jgi:hypothetical protein
VAAVSRLVLARRTGQPLESRGIAVDSCEELIAKSSLQIAFPCSSDSSSKN